jgi:hypothetical protein
MDAMTLKEMLPITLTLTLTMVACGDSTSFDPLCGPQSCSGCCDLQGNCQDGITSNACGTGGASCSACPAGESCIGGQCLSCDQSTCPTGCCQGGQCLPGDAASACGKGGLACQVCKEGESCVDGQCTTFGPCNPTTCPNGCCKGGQCMSGTSQTACGTGGLACVFCAIDQICAEGSCGTCDATTCADGCCEGNRCRPGNTDELCGTGGAACEACSDKEQCDSQACGPAPCGPKTCTGCCDAQGTCQTGDTDQECGTGGKACETCQGSLFCINNSCAWDPQAEWTVTVVSATINPFMVWDQGAFPGFIEPDVFMEVSCGGNSGKTDTTPNTYSPAFNEEVVTAKAKQLEIGVNIQVYDEDPFPADQLMGSCNISFPKASLEQGWFTVFNCGGPYVQNIQFSFAMK